MNKIERKYQKIRTWFYIIAFMLVIYSSGVLYIEIFDGFTNPVYHIPVLWSVNVYRFLLLTFALWLGGVAFGIFIIYFYARLRQTKLKKLDHATLIHEVIKKDG